ncbi:MAG: glycosyltransferase, partial [Bacteroidota bacterium]
DISWNNDRAAYKKIKEIINEFKPDIVHTHASKAGALGRLAASKMKVPVIVHTFHGHVFHSYFGKLKTSFYLNTERWLAKKSDAVIAISETQKKELVETYRICKSEKVKVVPLGFDLMRFEQNKDEKRKEFRKKYLVEDEEKVISIIGRLAPVKNHVFFVEVINQLLKTQEKSIRVFIIGDGETKNLIENKLNEYSIPFT